MIVKFTVAGFQKLRVLTIWDTRWRQEWGRSEECCSDGDSATVNCNPNRAAACDDCCSRIGLVKVGNGDWIAVIDCLVTVLDRGETISEPGSMTMSVVVVRASTKYCYYVESFATMTFKTSKKLCSNIFLIKIQISMNSFVMEFSERYKKKNFFVELTVYFWMKLDGLSNVICLF